MRHSKSTLPVISSFMKFCVARTFWVEQNLDVVLEVLQVVGSKNFFYKTCRYLPKKYDDCLINEGDIKLFELWKRKKRKREKKNEI